MRSLTEFKGRFKGTTITLIGGAVTSLDYFEVAKHGTDVVILINWAIRTAPLFNQIRHDVYFFTWHPEVFAAIPEILSPNITVAMFESGIHLFPSQLRRPPLLFRAANILPYEAYADLLPLIAADGGRCMDTHWCLFSSANTTLLALMFVWYTGCRSIRCVGMHDIGGKQKPHYDHRLAATNLPVSATKYVRDVEDFCRIMGIEHTYLGQP